MGCCMIKIINTYEFFDCIQLSYPNSDKKFSYFVSVPYKLVVFTLKVHSDGVV